MSFRMPKLSGTWTIHSRWLTKSNINACLSRRVSNTIRFQSKRRTLSSKPNSIQSDSLSPTNSTSTIDPITIFEHANPVPAKVSYLAAIIMLGVGLNMAEMARQGAVIRRGANEPTVKQRYGFAGVISAGFITISLFTMYLPTRQIIKIVLYPHYPKPPTGPNLKLWYHRSDVNIFSAASVLPIPLPAFHKGRMVPFSKVRLLSPINIVNKPWHTPEMVKTLIKPSGRRGATSFRILGDSRFAVPYGLPRDPLFWNDLDQFEEGLIFNLKVSEKFERRFCKP